MNHSANVETATEISIAPQRLQPTVRTYSSDGIAVRFEIAVVLRVSDPELAWRAASTFDAQVGDVINAVVADYATGRSAHELQLKPGEIEVHPMYEANERLRNLGAVIERLTIVLVALPQPYLAAVAQLALAGTMQQVALREAHGRRLQDEIGTEAELHHLQRLTELAEHLDPRLLELERLRTLRVAATAGNSMVIID